MTESEIELWRWRARSVLNRFDPKPTEDDRKAAIIFLSKTKQPGSQPDGWMVRSLSEAYWIPDTDGQVVSDG